MISKYEIRRAIDILKEVEEKMDSITVTSDERRYFELKIKSRDDEIEHLKEIIKDLKDNYSDSLELILKNTYPNHSNE